MDMALLAEPKFWTATAFVLFMAFLVYKKVPSMVARSLDERSAKIQAELEQAQKLREEAELVLAEYKRKQAEYLQEAEAMLQKAKSDSAALSATAEKDLQTALSARTQNALDRIEQEEARAIQDVRNHVVDIALAAARALIVDQVGNMSQDELVKLALADFERKIH